MKVIVDFPDSRRPVMFREFDDEIQCLDFVKQLCVELNERVRFQAETAQFGIVLEPPTDQVDPDVKEKVSRFLDQERRQGRTKG